MAKWSIYCHSTPIDLTQPSHYYIIFGKVPWKFLCSDTFYTRKWDSTDGSGSHSSFVLFQFKVSSIPLKLILFPWRKENEHVESSGCELKLEIRDGKRTNSPNWMSIRQSESIGHFRSNWPNWRFDQFGKSKLSAGPNGFARTEITHTFTQNGIMMDISNEHNVHIVLVNSLYLIYSCVSDFKLPFLFWATMMHGIPFIQLLFDFK